MTVSRIASYALKAPAILLSAIMLSGCSTSSLNNAGNELKDIVENQVDSDNEYVLMVKHGYRTDNPNLTYEKAFESFFGTPRWKYFKSTKGQDVVEFTGDCTYRDAQVKARIQFEVDKDKGKFEATYLSFNEVPQDKLTLAMLIEKALGENDSTTASEPQTDPPTEPPTEPETEYIAPKAYAEDMLNMTIGEIKSTYDVSILNIDSSRYENIFVEFQTRDGKKCPYKAHVDVYANGVNASNVPDETPVDGVILYSGAYLNENIYCGMSLYELEDVLGYELYPQGVKYGEGNPSATEFTSNGRTVKVVWFGDPGYEDTMSVYKYY